MSITVIGAFSRMGIQAPSTSSAIISKPKQSSKETSNRTPEPPRLHGDILHKIFNILHDESPSFLFPVLQVNHSFYELVMPILYRIIHLNRTTLRGLMDDPDDRRCWAWYWHNQTELARATTLVINDLYVLLDTRYDAALRKLCHRVRLPNVTKVIFRQDRQQTQRFKFHHAEFECFIARRPKPTWQDFGTWQRITNGSPLQYTPFQRSRARMFTNVLPNKNKTICVRISPNDNFQNLTNDRIIEYAGWLCGDNKVRIHQSVNPNYLTLNVSQEHPPLQRSVSTVYSFYQDLSGTPARPKLLRAFEIFLNRQVKPMAESNVPNWTSLHPMFMELINGSEDLKDILEAMTKAIRDPNLRRSPMYETWAEERRSLRALENVFVEIIAALGPDSETACSCCGEIGAPLNL
jgi:hypothetical protein